MCDYHDRALQRFDLLANEHTDLLSACLVHQDVTGGAATFLRQLAPPPIDLVRDNPLHHSAELSLHPVHRTALVAAEFFYKCADERIAQSCRKHDRLAECVGRGRWRRIEFQDAELGEMLTLAGRRDGFNKVLSATLRRLRLCSHHGDAAPRGLAGAPR